MESEVQHLSPEDSLQNTYDEVENAKGSVDLPSDAEPSAIAD